MRLIIAASPDVFHLVSLCAWPFDRSTCAVNSMHVSSIVGWWGATTSVAMHQWMRVFVPSKWKRGEDRKRDEKGDETKGERDALKMKIPFRRFARERRFSRREISLARFSARKRSAPPEGNICAGHFIRSLSTKESRDGFVNSFHTRPSPIHRGIASRVRASCASRGLVDGAREGFSRVDGICPVWGCRELVALFSCIMRGMWGNFF